MNINMGFWNGATLVLAHIRTRTKDFQMRLDGKLMAIKVKCYVLYEEVRGRKVSEYTFAIKMVYWYRHVAQKSAFQKAFIAVLQVIEPISSRLKIPSLVYIFLVSFPHTLTHTYLLQCSFNRLITKYILLPLWKSFSLFPFEENCSVWEEGDGWQNTKF